MFNAADSAFHGLGDVVRGQAGFESVIAATESMDLPDAVEAPVLFQAHVDLGRMRAWATDVEGARQHLQRARALRADVEGDDGAYHWARLTLLDASIAGAEGRIEDAQALLEGEVLGAARKEGPVWEELRADARIELERLGISSPGGADTAPLPPTRAPAESPPPPAPVPGG